MATVLDKAGGMFGFSEWRTGLGFMGNLTLWLFIVLVIFGIVAGIVIWLTIRKTYRYKVWTFGIIGNSAMLRWQDKGKYLKIGKVGDKLFYLKKQKRLVPPPELQSGHNLFIFWEREDGELINVRLTDLDKKMKELGIHFIHSDMRMQRLGIEKNLEFRHGKQTFWQKYGQTIINVVFYVIVTMMLIVLFVQWRKTADAIRVSVERAGEVYEAVTKGKEVSPNVPAMVFLFLAGKFRSLKWGLYQK